jgi:molecular chaperone GrpE
MNTETKSKANESEAAPTELTPEQWTELQARAANAALLQKLLPVLDNFEMAQAAAQSAQGDKLASLQTGIAMIQQQLKGALTESGLEELDASGKPFDPTFHEAVSQQESDKVPEGQVLQQIRKGYKFRERLLRPSAVIVAKKPASE